MDRHLDFAMPNDRVAAIDDHGVPDELARAADLSIIVIGRNEETRIGTCLRAVFASLKSFDNYEVIYVDSASEDGTVAVAQHFPIRIIQLKPDWKLSPSAGRYIGYQHARGRFLMFVDGDTLLYKRWVKTASDFLTREPQCGGVAGIVHEAYQSARGQCVAVEKNRYGQDRDVHIQPAVSLGGIAMYRREAMEAAGTFNPYLTAGEEGEVALRIRSAGFPLYRLSVPMCLTYAPPRESFMEVLRRSRTCLYDFGTSLRYCLANNLGLRYLREELWFVCTFLGSAVLSFVGIVVAFALGMVWPIGVVAFAGVLYLLVKRKPPKLVLVSILKRGLISYRTCASFLGARVLPIENYPTDVIVVK